MTTRPDELPEDPLRRLEAVMDVLRGPEGCPWDREQDHRTLRSHLLEETYEVLSVLDDPRGPDDAALVEELGDLLLQIVFHARLGAERGSFDLDRVAGKITEKLIRRHPHVFGTAEVEGPDDVLHNWERLKQEEGKDSALEGVPPSLPALARASRLAAKARRAGFTWKDASGAADKVEEEWAEVREAGEDREEVRRELGDLLLALAVYAERREVDPESALREAAARFQARFERLEGRAREAGMRLQQAGEERLLGWWESAGQEEGDP
ncbi:MAG: nucleoside triphosphate pyrophosphohydrolase [bacterium]